jgi:hypothetical protein
MVRPLVRPRSDQELASRGHPVPHGAPLLPPGTPEHHVRELAEHFAAMRESNSGLARLIKRLSDPGVLETATQTIPALGAYTQDRYRVPYAAVAVLNPNATSLIVSSGPAQGAAPGGGQGQFEVPPNTFVCMNLAGSSLTVYGAAGTTFSYSVLIGRVQPFAASIGPGSSGSGASASLSTYDETTGPAAGAALATLSNLPAGDYAVTVEAYYSGILTAADVDNLGLVQQSTFKATILMPEGTLGQTTVQVTNPATGSPAIWTNNTGQPVTLLYATAFFTADSTAASRYLELFIKNSSGTQIWFNQNTTAVVASDSIGVNAGQGYTQSNNASGECFLPLSPNLVVPANGTVSFVAANMDPGDAWTNIFLTYVPAYGEAAVNQPFEMNVNVPVAGQDIWVQAIAAGGGGATYHVTLTATPL